MVHRISIALGAALAAGASLAVAAQAPTQATPLAAPPAPGSWTHVSVPGGSEASFVDASGRAQVIVRCTRATRQVSILRAAAGASSGVQLWTSSGLRQLPATYDAATAQVRADVAVTDPVLDALAFSQGRFAVGALGYAPLVVPNWPEPTRAIEDCRN